MGLRRYANKRDEVEPGIAVAVFPTVKPRAVYGSRIEMRTCEVCGKSFRGRNYGGRGRFCSRECCNKGKAASVGSKNPNFKDAGKHICLNCKLEFKNYNKSRKYCCFDCSVSGRSAGKKPRVLKGIPYKVPVLTCRECGVQYRKRQAFCSMQCKMSATLKRNTRTCAHCGGTFVKVGSKERRFCSYSCHLKSGGAVRAGHFAVEAIMKKYGAKKDANHAEVFAAMRLFCPVLDLSRHGYGLPDGLANINGELHLFDVKNPKTAYGKKGLNRRQKEWLNECRGTRVFLIYSVDEAIQFAKGNFEGLKVQISSDEVAA